jgi:hypothetical protein
MPGRQTRIDPGPSELRAELDLELLRLSQSSNEYGPAEGLMRLRALSEIGALLGTDALLELAVTLGSVRRPKEIKPPRTFQ